MLLTILKKWIQEDKENYSIMEEGSWMWFFVDIILDVWNIFHFLVVISIVLKGDVSYKRGLVQSHYDFLQLVRPVLFLRHVATLWLGMLTIYCCWYSCHDEEQQQKQYPFLMIRGVVAGYTCISAMLLQKCSMALLKLSPERMMEVEHEIEQYDIKHFEAPPKWLGKLLFGGLESILRPTAMGLDEHVHVDKASLYVTNHLLHGIEMPLLLKIVYERRNIFLRGVADRCHFGLPQGIALRYVGAFNGSRENVEFVMKEKEHILLYPGGSHEVMKHSSTKRYELLWKERLGFARLAIKNGYPIIPCASVGTEDMMHIALDIPVQSIRKDQSLPLIWPILPHEIQRLYFWFGKAIPTIQYKGEWQNDEYCRQVRDETKAAVLEGIRILQARQAADPDRYLWRYCYNRLLGRTSTSNSSSSCSTTESTTPIPSKDDKAVKSD